MVESSSTLMDELRAEVDTSRPFRSVKEAVAVFGERLLAAEVYSHSGGAAPRGNKISRPLPFSPSVSLKSLAPEREAALERRLKSLESELEETRRELNLLKKRESEVELAVAALRADLQKNTTSLVEAEEAANPSKTGQSWEIVVESFGGHVENEQSAGLPCTRTLAQLLSFDVGDGPKGILRKEKPIIPLISNVLSRKNAASPKPRHSGSRFCSRFIC